MHGILAVWNLNMLLSKANFQNKKGNVNLQYTRSKAETLFGIKWLSWFSAYAELTSWAIFQPLWLLMRKGFLWVCSHKCRLLSAFQHYVKDWHLIFMHFLVLEGRAPIQKNFYPGFFSGCHMSNYLLGKKNGFFYLTSKLIFILNFGMEFSPELVRFLPLAVGHVKEEMYKCLLLAKDNIAFWSTWLTSGRENAAAQSALPRESSWKQGRRR